MATGLLSVTRVLIVDDDEVMRDVLSMVLASEGYEVSTAESGDDALTQLAAMSAEEMPECVLTDLQMPGICGAALGERLLEVCPASTMLIAMSGSFAKQSETAVFDAFLLKPFGPEEFLAAIEGAERAAEEPGGAQALTPLDETIYAKLGQSMAPAQLSQLYALCLDDAEGRIGRMRASAEAGEADAFVKEAHAVKGGCGMLGATELHALADRMETGALASTPLLDEFTVAADRLRRMLEAHSH